MLINIEGQATATNISSNSVVVDSNRSFSNYLHKESATLTRYVAVRSNPDRTPSLTSRSSQQKRFSVGTTRAQPNGVHADSLGFACWHNRPLRGPSRPAFVPSSLNYIKIFWVRYEISEPSHLVTLVPDATLVTRNEGRRNLSFHESEHGRLCERMYRPFETGQPYQRIPSQFSNK